MSKKIKRINKSNDVAERMEVREKSYTNHRVTVRSGPKQLHCAGILVSFSAVICEEKYEK